MKNNNGSIVNSKESGKFLGFIFCEETAVAETLIAPFLS